MLLNLKCWWISRHLKASSGWRLQQAAVQKLVRTRSPRALELLLRSLDHLEQGVRKDALAELGKFADRRIIPLLLGFVEHGVLHEPSAAAKSLRELGAAEDVAALMSSSSSAIRGRVIDIVCIWPEVNPGPRIADLLWDPEPRIRAKAAAALPALGYLTAQQDLRRMTREDPVPETRAAALEALHGMGGLESIPTLVAASNDDPEPVVRRAAALALADFAAAEVKVALLAALRDPEDMVRRAALWSLARQGHPEWEQLLDINLRGREVEFPSLDDAAARETLIWLVQQDRLPFDRKGPLLMFLSRNAKPELLDLLLAALHSGELRIETATGIPQARMAAIKVVGATRSPKVVDVLLRHLRHDDAAVRREAVEALGKLPAPLNIQGLATSLGCQDQDVRALAGEKLAALGLPHFRDAALVEPNYLNELAMLRDERTTEAVIWALSSGDKDVRAAAVHALPLRCQAKALQAGLRMLNDKEPSVQCAAVEAIEDFAQHPGRPEGYGAIVEALSADDSSSPLAALCRWDAELRMRLAVAVAVLGQPQWRDLIRGNTEDFGRLARTGSACFVGPLLEGLTQWPHAGRVAAAKALAIMHRLRPELLGDRWQKVRELAAQPHVDKILDEWDRRQDYDGYWHSDGHLSYGIGVEL